MSASVKIMLSHNYCHFEVSKSIDGEVTDKEINELRKSVQRLADESVRQYQIAKEKASHNENIKWKKEEMETRIKRILEIAEEDRSPEQKALIKHSEDKEFYSQFDRDEYDYEDDEETYNW